MIDNDKIKQIIEDCKPMGCSVRVRDIAYVLLCKAMSANIAYQCLFATQEGFENYDKSAEVKAVTQCVIKNEAEDDGITFEQNRKEMENLLKETQKSMDDGLVDRAVGLKILADIRVKLNDKFNVQSQEQERVIVVEKKYNHICERFNCECYLPTVDDLKEMYNLVEKQ